MVDRHRAYPSLRTSRALLCDACHGSLHADAPTHSHASVHHASASKPCVGRHTRPPVDWSTKSVVSLVASTRSGRPAQFHPQPRPRSAPTHDHTDHAAAPPSTAVAPYAGLRARTQKERQVADQPHKASASISYAEGADLLAEDNCIIPAGYPLRRNFGAVGPTAAFLLGVSAKSVSFVSLGEEFHCLVRGERCRSVARCW
jgi:hypothetical protein